MADTLQRKIWVLIRDAGRPVRAYLDESRGREDYALVTEEPEHFYELIEVGLFGDDPSESM